MFWDNLQHWMCGNHRVSVTVFVIASWKPVRAASLPPMLYFQLITLPRSLSICVEARSCNSHIKREVWPLWSQVLSPNSTASCYFKIFEGFVRKQLLSHCLNNNIIPDEQFGFLPKLSVVWQLLAVVEERKKAFDKGRLVHACFLDIAKAFNRVITVFSCTSCLVWG